MTSFRSFIFNKFSVHVLGTLYESPSLGLTLTVHEVTLGETEGLTEGLKLGDTEVLIEGLTLELIEGDNDAIIFKNNLPFPTNFS